MEIIFGPVASRRLGRSLGINLVPGKICSLDCLYCEVGKTNAKTIKRAPYISADRVLAEFNKIYPEMLGRIDVITLTANGEPTLNTEIGKIIDGINAVKKHPLVVLTNSTTIGIPDVDEALNKVDILIPSLDAALQASFEKVDQPYNKLNVKDIINNLENFSKQYNGKLWLEILLVKEINDSPEDIKALTEAARRIKHDKILLGTVFRPPAYSSLDDINVKRLSDSELEDVYLYMKKQGLNVEPVGAFSAGASAGTPAGTDFDGARSMLVNLLKLRPVTALDIETGMGISPELREKLLKSIAAEGILKEQNYEADIYYSI